MILPPEAVAETPDRPGARILESALLVDFDNIHALLTRKWGTRVAGVFAQDPTRWAEWLQQNATAGSRAGNAERQFTHGIAYFSNRSAHFASMFSHAGFEVRVCPPVSKAGKNAADIRIALDALEMAIDDPELDEVIVLSSDSDFTPIKPKLHARNVAFVIVDLDAPAALKDAADETVDGGHFAKDALGARPSEYQPDGRKVSHAPAGSELSELLKLRKELSSFVFDFVHNSPEAVRLGALTPALMTRFPILLLNNWAGCGGVEALLSSLDLRSVEFVNDGSRSPYLWDRSTHVAPTEATELMQVPAGKTTLAARIRTMITRRHTSQAHS